MTGVPVAIDSIATRPNGSGQPPSISVARAPAIRRSRSAVPTSPAPVDDAVVDRRLHDRLEQRLLVAFVDLGRHDQPQAACGPRHLDGLGHALLGRDPANEQEVVAGRLAEIGVGREVEPVVDRGDPVGALFQRR